MDTLFKNIKSNLKATIRHATLEIRYGDQKLLRDWKKVLRVKGLFIRVVMLVIRPLCEILTFEKKRERNWYQLAHYSQELLASREHC